MPVDPALRHGVDFLHAYQKRAVADNARFTMLNWSRQIGKSTAITLRRIIRGVSRRRNQIFLSAGERQSRELMMKAQTHIRAMKLASELSECKPFAGATFKQLEIAIPGAGIRIIGLPANPTTARGFTGDVFLDEFAMHEHDSEIFAAVFPAVMRGDGELDIASTPNGRQNMFYQLRDNPSFSRSTVTIHDAIAEGLDVDLPALRSVMVHEDDWRQEFECEFVDSTTAFLTYEIIGECEDPRLPSRLDVEGLADRTGDVVLGVDIGRKHDLTVLWAFEVVGSQLISLGMIELSGMRFRAQFDLISSAIEQRCMRRCCIDSTGLGMQLAEELQDRFGEHLVEACTFTAGFKQQAAGALRVRHHDRTIRYAPDLDTRNDLHSIRRTVTSTGSIRLDAPRDGTGHADRFWAAALACHAASDMSVDFACEVGPQIAGAGFRSW